MAPALSYSLTRGYPSTTQTDCPLFTSRSARVCCPVASLTYGPNRTANCESRQDARLAGAALGKGVTSERHRNNAPSSDASARFTTSERGSVISRQIPVQGTFRNAGPRERVALDGFDRRDRAAREARARCACKLGRVVGAGYGAIVETHPLLDDLGLTGAGYAASVTGGPGVGFNAGDSVSPASVMKIQVALAVERAIASGSLEGSATRVLSPEQRTPGPVGVSLMLDEVRMSVRDLVVAMLTISDNVATDELIDLVGLDQINCLTRELGLEQTLITSTLRDALDEVAGEAGFATYAALVAHEPGTMGPPSDHDIRTRLYSSAALDPTRGTRTTAAETVGLLQAIWTNQAAPAEACASIRLLMGQQLTRQRIASAFAPPVSVAAKSGGLLGVARNEAGVVTFPDGAALAVAVFTRREPSIRLDPAVIDSTIGAIARDLIGRLHHP